MMIHVIVNPAAGTEKPILATLNSVFRAADSEWDISVTHRAGDALKQTQQAVADGAKVVAACGGDGTVVEVASGLYGTDVPLAVLPGGTANVVAQELAIPRDLAAACQLACGGQSTIRHIDMGAVNDLNFLLRVGLGTEAQIIEKANRELKNKLGFLAYVWSAAQSLTQVRQATYHLSVDGEAIEVEGITCGIINSSRFGLGELKIVPGIRIDDGLLDVLVVQKANLSALAGLISGMMGWTDTKPGSSETPTFDSDHPICHWQGSQIDVRVEPRQSIQYDGEILEADTISCRVHKRALGVIVPKTSRA